MFSYPLLWTIKANETKEIDIGFNSNSVDKFNTITILSLCDGLVNKRKLNLIGDAVVASTKTVKFIRTKIFEVNEESKIKI